MPRHCIAGAKVYVCCLLQLLTPAAVPPPPACRRYGWSTSRTMSVAQQLYEGPAGTSEGLITYMRTDGYYIAEDALTAIRGHIGSRWGSCSGGAAAAKISVMEQNGWTLCECMPLLP